MRPILAQRPAPGVDTLQSQASEPAEVGSRRHQIVHEADQASENLQRSNLQRSNLQRV
jgi:hypothetical protein